MIINKIIINDRVFVESINTNKINLKNYLNWLSDKDSNRFILATKESWNHNKLIQFINTQNNSEQTALLGIFDQSNGSHIGNIKYENIYSGSRNCSLGILVGEPNYRGVGIATAVISETIKKISARFSIFEFFLGVDKENETAIRTYTKLGFKFIENPENNAVLQMAFKC
jgi:RimJ/RimL family protein N-acetyltransferase